MSSPSPAPRAATQNHGRDVDPGRCWSELPCSHRKCRTHRMQAFSCRCNLLVQRKLSHPLILLSVTRNRL